MASDPASGTLSPSFPVLVHGPTFSPGQWAVLVALWLLLFLVPAYLVRRHAARMRNPVGHYWFWSTVVMGPLGVYAYWMDRKVRARKGELYDGERAPD